MYLNSDMRVISHERLREEDHDQDEQLFIRPDDGLKRWSGEVITFEKYCAWYENFGDDMRAEYLAVSSVKEIEAEWRFILVDGQIVGSSQYTPIPMKWTSPEAADFAQAAAGRWTPLPVTVMDVALTPDGLKVIELNCFNGSSFYLADIGHVVRNVSLYLESIQNET